jgi:outer membrane protein TolC
MARLLAFSFALIAVPIAVFAADELPKHDGDDSFEIEPPLLIPNRETEGSRIVAPAEMSAPVADPDRLEQELERAKKRAKGAERLFKMGALAKVEAEQRSLRVARLQSDLENARLAHAKEEMRLQDSRVTAGEISKADVIATERALARAIEAAHSATARREQAEVDFAESNLHRQQKLLALGSARKSDVNRAEEKLAELKTPKN